MKICNACIETCPVCIHSHNSTGICTLTCTRICSHTRTYTDTLTNIDILRQGQANTKLIFLKAKKLRTTFLVPFSFARCHCFRNFSLYLTLYQYVCEPVCVQVYVRVRVQVQVHTHVPVLLCVH